MPSHVPQGSPSEPTSPIRNTFALPESSTIRDSNPAPLPATTAPATAATTTTAIQATTTTDVSTSSSTRGTHIDFGVTRPAARISQNDDRLPQRTPSLQPSSGSDRSGTANTSIGLLPTLDESPASQVPSNLLTQFSIQSSSQSQVRSFSDLDDAGIDPTDSQDIAHLVHSDTGPSGPESGNSSYQEESSHSSNHSKQSNTSIRQGNTSFHSSSNTSTHSQASTSMNSQDVKGGPPSTPSSSDPNSSSSGESQVSDLSFTNVVTSSPHHTPQPSDSSTQSSSDHSQNQIPSQNSPSVRQKRRADTNERNSVQGSSSSSSQQRTPGSKQSGPTTFAVPRPRSSNPSTITGSNESASDEIVHNTPTDDENDTQVRHPLAHNVSSIGFTPPAAVSSLVAEPSLTQRALISRAPARDLSLVDVGSDDEEIDPSMSHSRSVSRALSFTGNRRANESTSSAAVEITTTTTSKITVSTKTSAMASSTTATTAGVKPESRKRSSMDDVPTPHTDDAVSYVSENDDDSDTTIPESPLEKHHSSPGVLEGSIMSNTIRGTAAYAAVRSRHSPPPYGDEVDELPSSQGSRTFRSTPGGSLTDRLRAMAKQKNLDSVPTSSLEFDPSLSTPLLAIPKRRKMLEQMADTEPLQSSTSSRNKDQQAKHVPSSVDDDTWETSQHDENRGGVRSRSRSQDISSYPNDNASEIDESSIDIHFGANDESASQNSAQSAGPPSPPPKNKSSSQSKSRAIPVTSQTRTQRRRSIQSASQSTHLPTSPRRSLRRLTSVMNDLRAYKAEEAVWAKWKKRDYYAGVVTERKTDKYRIWFLDNDYEECDPAEMRPMRLKLGAQVLAQKTEAYFPAIVEGVHMSSDLKLSRVDVRFEQDGGEANYDLGKICLTTDMMAALDSDLAMDVEAEELKRLEGQQQRGRISRETSSSMAIKKVSSPVSSPPRTPTKGKSRTVGLPQRTLSGHSVPSTPTRRDKAALFNVGVMTPSRRSKELFKDYQFVLSLSGGANGSLELERIITTKIKSAGGEIFSDLALLDVQRRPNAQVMLIAVKHLRTPKYMEALAMNIPRLSYRWIEACVEDRQILPYQSYLLPTGMSLELDAVISAVPIHERGVFENVTIGLCGSKSFREVWERILIVAGAKVEIVSAKTGPKDCDYVVFYDLKAHERYSQGVVVTQSTSSASSKLTSSSVIPLPTLTVEWMVQCLINQRVVSITGHPIYTELQANAQQ